MTKVLCVLLSGLFGTVLTLPSAYNSHHVVFPSSFIHLGISGQNRQVGLGRFAIQQNSQQSGEEDNRLHSVDSQTNNRLLETQNGSPDQQDDVTDQQATTLTSQGNSERQSASTDSRVGSLRQGGSFDPHRGMFTSQGTFDRQRNNRPQSNQQSRQQTAGDRTTSVTNTQSTAGFGAQQGGFFVNPQVYQQGELSSSQQTDFFSGQQNVIFASGQRSEGRNLAHNQVVGFDERLNTLYANQQNGQINDSSETPNYVFWYQVIDPASNIDMSHGESRIGDNTEGRYHVNLPDGRTQLVRYTADQAGYRPLVSYQGEENTPRDSIA